MSASPRNLGVPGYDPDEAVSGLPITVRDPVGLVLELWKHYSDAGDRSLLERLRAIRSEPDFRCYVWAPMEVAYAFFPSSGGDVRSAGTRQRRRDLETWIAVPAALKTAVNQEHAYRVGQLGYLLVYRRSRNAFSTFLLMMADARMPTPERERWIRDYWSSPFVVASKHNRDVPESHRAGHGPSQPTHKLQMRSLWLEAGKRRMTPTELSLIVAHYLIADGVLVDKERATVLRATERWIAALISKFELATGTDPIDVRAIEQLQRDFARYLGQWRHPQPGALVASVRKAWRRKVSAAFTPRRQVECERDEG